MAWIASQDFRSSIQLFGRHFRSATLRLCAPAGSPLRKPLNVAILNAVQSRWWDDTLFRYIGNR